jgi:hypothetical protein
VRCYSADKRAYTGLNAHSNRRISAGSVTVSDIRAEHNSRTQGDEQAQAASHLCAGLDQ